MGISEVGINGAAMFMVLRWTGARRNVMEKSDPNPAPDVIPAAPQAKGRTPEATVGAGPALPLATCGLLFFTSLVWTALWFVFIVVACRAERFRDHQWLVAAFGVGMLLIGGGGMLVSVDQALRRTRRLGKNAASNTP